MRYAGQHARGNIAAIRPFPFAVAASLRRRTLFVIGCACAAVVAVGCRGGDDAAPQIGSGSDGESGATGGATAGTDSTTTGGDGDGDSGPPREPSPPGGTMCPDLSCLPCGNGRGCATEGEPLGESCCVVGDPLVGLATASGAEIVDLETDGRYVINCGGFGATINDIADPTMPTTVAGAGSRCQRAAFGETLGTDGRIFWIAHHGDSWVETPFLATYHLQGGAAVEHHKIEDPEILFEGLAYHDGVLYVAVHDGGIRVYETDGQGVPTFVTAVGGLTNATKLDVMGGRLYVADGAGGLAVLDVSDPLAPTMVEQVSTLGLARDVEAEDGRVYVALGADGVQVFDATGDGALQDVGRIEALGSVQAVDVEGDLVALAAWTHVAVHDAQTFALLGTEKVRFAPEFEQDLGIALHEDLVVVGEWEAVHLYRYQPGHISPDIWLDAESYAFDASQPGSKVVAVRNRGYLDLDVGAIETSNDAFVADASSLFIPPLEARAFEIAFDPELSPGYGMVTLESNVPDPTRSPMRARLVAQDSSLLDVGDPIGPEFGFLDPNGAGQVEGLEGHVVVLAYFALF